jgi:transcriptional regulator with XRE-family HTH domain
MRTSNTVRVFLSTPNVCDGRTQSRHNQQMDHKTESARRLRRARIDAGYDTIEALAAATGHVYSVSRLGNYEQGTRAMAPHVADSLAKILGVSASWLLCLDNDGLSPDERRLLKNYRLADKRGQDVIYRIAETEAESYGRGGPGPRDPQSGLTTNHQRIVT